MTLTDKLLYFWFGTNNLTKSVEKREVWFKATPEFDQAIADNFLNAYEKAAANDLDHLCNDRSGCLTLIVLLDQLPRNLFRNSGKAYGTDQKARSIAYDALEKGFDKKISLWHKVFIYLPLQHSEDIDDQYRSVELFTKLNIKSATEAAIGHKEIIEKFGRFPYRNDALGRTTTSEEIEFLKDPPPWGKTKAEFEEMVRKNNTQET